MATTLIGLDWGTSSLRAYRLDGDGGVIERKAAPLGILQIEGGAFEDTFEREIGPWLDAAPDAPVLASGMIASRQGWVEAPYVACPAGEAELARALLEHRTARGRTLRFVPGLSLIGADDVPDVMRGEETQIAGAIGTQEGPALLVLPGTHSKWALAEDGRITWFATFMTGELYGVLVRHSILGRLMTGEAEDEGAFARGVGYAGEGGSGLLKRLFSARTLGLFGELPGSGVGAYLSGLLIGTEIAEALAWSRPPAEVDTITVIGGAGLASGYRRALALKGLRAETSPEDAAARGLFRIARAAGLLA